LKLPNLKRLIEKEKGKKEKLTKLDSNLDPKLSLDKYFPNRKNYLLSKDIKTKDSASY